MCFFMELPLKKYIYKNKISFIILNSCKTAHDFKVQNNYMNKVTNGK